MANSCDDQPPSSIPSPSSPVMFPLTFPYQMVVDESAQNKTKTVMYNPCDSLDELLYYTAVPRESRMDGFDPDKVFEEVDDPLMLIKYENWVDNLFCLSGTGYLTGALLGTAMGSFHAYWKLLHNSGAAPPSLGVGFLPSSKRLFHTAAAFTTTTTTKKQLLVSGLKTGRRFGGFLGFAGLLYPVFEFGVLAMRAKLSGPDWIPGRERDKDILHETVAGFCAGASCKALSGPKPAVFTGVSVKPMSGPRATALAGALGAVAALVGNPLARKLGGISIDSD